MATQSLARAVTRANKWRERYNPLRGLSVERCIALTESYLTGSYGELMWAYMAPMVGVESADPDYLALIDRRTSRLMEMEWDIRIAEDKDQDPRAQRQQEVLRAAYDRFDDLYALIEHLAMAAFRGFAHVEVDWRNSVLTPIPQWATVRDGTSGGWKYNTGYFGATWESLPDDTAYDPAKHWWIIREHPRPIGAWALIKYFYTALSARDWASYCSIYGIPGGVVIGPQSVPEQKEAAYQSSAEEISQGGSGFLPFGSQWVPNTGARGSQPFQAWLEWLSQKLILAGTGGMLTMLNDATGIGSGQSDAHQDTFADIAAGEARKISELLQRQFDRRVLQANGLLDPGERPLAWWQLAARAETDPAAIATTVQTLSTAGYQVDPAQVSEETGLQVTIKPQPTAQAPTGPSLPTALFNRLQQPLQALQLPTGGLADPSAVPTPAPGGTAGLSPRIQEALDLLENDSGDASLRRALEIFDSLTPEDLKTDEKAQALEARLMEAVIAGAASRPRADSSGGAGVAGTAAP